MWRLESAQGRWHTSQFQFQIDLAHPDQGWREVLIDGVPVADRLFQLLLPGHGDSQVVVDSYVRQADLVVTYAQGSDRTVRPQLVWRALRDGETRVGAELILSMQTSLLESCPGLAIQHQLGGELLRIDDQQLAGAEQGLWDLPTALLHRPASVDAWSLVLAVHPADFESLQIQEEQGVWRTSFAMFPHSLEKGVIRRGRMRGVFVSREDDVELAHLTLGELTQAAPPLTT